MASTSTAPLLGAQPGDWAVVAGGTTTVGEQFARQLAARGLNVVVVARRAAPVQALAAAVHQETGVQTLGVPLDLSTEGAVDALVAAVGDRVVHCLVVNANLHTVGVFDALGLDTKLQMVRMNLELPVRLVSAFGPGMTRRGRGAIVAVNALNALVPIEKDAVFQGTKAGLQLLMESVALDYARHGVTVANAFLAGIEGSESYEAKLSERTRWWVGFFGASLPPATIVSACLAQLARGRTVLVPEGPLPWMRLALWAMTATRALAGTAAGRLWSWVFGRLLNGEHAQQAGRD